jgi:hypothetical protein
MQNGLGSTVSFSAANFPLASHTTAMDRHAPSYPEGQDSLNGRTTDMLCSARDPRAAGACERRAYLCRKKRFLAVWYTKCPQI